MKLREAITYAKENHVTLLENNSKLVGVAHTPNDGDGEVHIVQVAMNEEDPDWYDIFIEGGFIPDKGWGTEDYIGNDNVDKLLTETPKFALDLNYKLYSPKYLFGFTTDHALHHLFPELPDPDLWTNDTKNKAIQIINELNNQ